MSNMHVYIERVFQKRQIRSKSQDIQYIGYNFCIILQSSIKYFAHIYLKGY